MMNSINVTRKKNDKNVSSVMGYVLLSQIAIIGILYFGVMNIIVK